MPKITFIGAGSLGFTRKLVRDILTFPRLQDATISLMDIDPERLDFARRAVERIVELGNYPARVEATLDRAEALDGADYVMVTILAGGVDIWRHDIEIPKKYGVDTNIGDTRGPSGIFRALRTIPVMLEIARDMERYCPHATMLNYTNPMAMLCRALQRETRIQLTGLCHSVQGTAAMLARWIGAPMEEITYTCAGINHMAWYLRYEWNGQDAYPLIRKAVTERPEVYNEEIVRNEMFLALDYYVTESSGHNSEYNWWFRKRPDLIEKYCTHGTGWNPGEYAYVVKRYQEREQTWREEAKKWFAAETPIDLQRGHEYAAYIVNALEGGEPFQFNGNVANKGLVTNLPEDACVEVPVWASRNGLEAVRVGPLPPQCAMLTNLSAQIEEMAVEGALTGNPRLVYQAIAHDPLTAAVLSLAEIRQMVNEMFEQNRDYLPQFKHFKV
ncbi:alpha-galactosidase [Litorilinea aerophila]|uniref:Alpha-galactosidase n=1 Tax=Litorilinea aerophila TaxID=1204385 RepID=A0A540VIS2_9CHLR|nr:alpha-galactosidase [Litorilinea aerophila]MCC9075899.1 alpha-galactosidase [Litorilinea aerophila]OUC04923.1 alpha-mannosidase [Litorilinea aerophila]GIV77170.1 MAG: alpha-glucosidase/alpha-galactosidase [Litorilinea sp.]